jgi:lipoprotein-anchoring transpeptidase ErfK/SrfK
MEAMKRLPHMGYTGPREALAEKFHMSPALLAALNPRQRFDRVGHRIVVIDTAAAAAPAKAQRVEVDKSRQTVTAFDNQNRLVGFYPATVGSADKPSPSGELKVVEIDPDPNYRYNPKYKFKGVWSRIPFTIRPGPNNPVGTVWIQSNAEGYGLHRTPEPSKVSKAQSHGCVRLANWDAHRLAGSLARGAPVAFVDGR